MTGLSNGNFVVTWQSQDQDGSSNGIYSQIFTASGVKSGPEFLVNTYADGDQSQPSVTGLTNGNFVVTWQSRPQDGSIYGVYGQIFYPLGVSADPLICYTEDTTYDLDGIAIVSLNNPSITATLTLSNPSAGTLSTAVSGSIGSTYNTTIGVWQASGNIQDVNTLLAGIQFVPTLLLFKVESTKIMF